MWTGRDKNDLQLNLTLTNFKGPTSFICYRRNSVIAKIGNKGKWDYELASAIGGTPLLVGPFEWGLTV